VKRVFDVTTALLGIVLLSPVFFLVTILIWLDSGMPILYRGIRTGLNGSTFRMLKFRTMVKNAEKIGGPSTGKNDPRVTRLGRFLRHYKVDELPQLINVLRGEMSIVGPRPEVPQYTKLYTGDEELILSIRPGITDYASLRFRHLAEELGPGEVDRNYEERVRPLKNQLRVRYVKERNFWIDLKIIMRTLCQLFN
jgi:lipopolysaccharide/colanic/teichoic acid biosynthesis glycosyltransferase